MYPIKMSPVFKSYLWGGDKLRSKYGKNTPYDITAESWELACHRNGESRACGGEFDGKTISEIVEIMGNRLLGDKVTGMDKFPLLIKLIDAKDNLSVQVHPNDNYAFENENGELGKNEMWYIMEAEEGAGIFYGFYEDIDKEVFKKAIDSNNVEKYARFIPCKKGDFFYIPAGTLHAIGKGLVIAEIQQNSDTTYRVYDYDRRDKDGNPRELHTQKALEVLDYKASSCPCSPKTEGIIIESEYFITEKIILNGLRTFKISKDRFEAVICCEGCCDANGVSLKEGDTILVPAYIGNLTLNGKGEFLRTYVNL